LRRLFSRGVTYAPAYSTYGAIEHSRSSRLLSTLSFFIAFLLVLRTISIIQGAGRIFLAKVCLPPFILNTFFEVSFPRLILDVAFLRSPYSLEFLHPLFVRLVNPRFRFFSDAFPRRIGTRFFPPCRFSEKVKAPRFS